MIVKQVKISNQSKERLSRLKGKTGISFADGHCAIL